jgi:DNA-binding response OmpR family regulator
MIIEDDKNLIEYLSDLLTQENYSVKQINNETKALIEIDRILPNLIILDLMLPNIKGETLCKVIKANYPDIPVIILTGKNNLSDKINVFDLGADDYITKPFEPEELIRRIRARTKDNTHPYHIVKIEDLEINADEMSVKRNNKDIKLTAQEFKLLLTLVENAGRVLTRENLLSKIWPNSFEIETRVIDVYISYLRKKIDYGHKYKLIQSVRGFGYVIRKTTQSNN